MERFLVDAIGGALELGIATHDDVLKHVTPDVLAQHLPRPIWARLLGACLAAPKVDARLVVETIGVADLCANIPGAILWGVLADVANRALGKGLVAAPPPPAVVAAEEPRRGSSASGPVPAPKPFGPVTRPTTSPGVQATPATATPVTRPSAPITPATGVPVVTVPPAPSGSNRAVTVTATQTSAAPAPTAAVDIVFDDDDDEPAPLEAPPVTPRGSAPDAPRARNGTRPPTGAGASTRRPQASASMRSTPRTTPPSQRRAAASSDFDLDTDVSMDGSSRAEVEVDDDQLVDWSASEETVTSGLNDHRRKR